MSEMMSSTEQHRDSVFMSSQSGKISEREAYTRQSLVFDPDSITEGPREAATEFVDRTQESINMGLTYSETQQDNRRFVEISDFSRISSYANEAPTILPVSTSFTPDVTTFPLSLIRNSYTSQEEVQSFFTASDTTEFVERKPLLGAELSVPNPPIMAHHYRSSHSYGSERDLYPGSATHYARTPDRSETQNSVAYLSFVRDETSPNGSGSSSSPRNFAAFSNETQDTPPFDAMQNVGGNMLRFSGQAVEIDLHAKVEKGFFIAPDNEWTCYRRNYFGVSCSFSLTPHHRVGNYEVETRGGIVQHASGFAMGISASVDSEKGKVVELIQHTPKRDKGPQTRPTFVALQPRPPIANTIYGNYNGVGSSALYNPVCDNHNMQPQIPTEHSFERIQFKQATANNGKRRAAQQYYHVIVTLYADMGPQADNQYVKLASRSSAALVVRGRSPGHYQDARANPRSESENGNIFGGGVQYTRIGLAEQRMLPGVPSSQSPYVYSNSYDERTYNHAHEPRQYSERDYGSSQWVDDRTGNLAMVELPATPSYSESDSQNYERQVAYTFSPTSSTHTQTYSSGQPLSTGSYTPGTAIYMPSMPTYSMSPPNSVYRDDRSNSFASNGSLASYNAGNTLSASPRPRFDRTSRDLPPPLPMQPFDRFRDIPSANGLAKEYFAPTNFGTGRV